MTDLAQDIADITSTAWDWEQGSWSDVSDAVIEFLKDNPQHLLALLPEGAKVLIPRPSSEVTTDEQFIAALDYETVTGYTAQDIVGYEDIDPVVYVELSQGESEQ